MLLFLLQTGGTQAPLFLDDLLHVLLAIVVRDLITLLDVLACTDVYTVLFLIMLCFGIGSTCMIDLASSVLSSFAVDHQCISHLEEVSPSTLVRFLFGYALTGIFDDELILFYCFTVTEQSTTSTTTTDANLIQAVRMGSTYNVVQSLPSTDLNGDGRQTIADTSTLLLHLGSSDMRYDLNGDGAVNFTDFNIILTAQ